MLRNLTFAAAGAVLLLGGCASPSQVADSVVNANVAQELAHNRLVLLNIVRAYKREPMHFSRMSAARLPVGIGNPTFSLPTPFGPESLVLRYDWSTSLGIQQGVDSAPLDSQEFMRGITTPLSVTTMLYYLDQGWPQQMILHLFVRSVEVTKTVGSETTVVKRLVNAPQNAALFEKFKAAMLDLSGCEIDPLQDRSPSRYGPVFAAKDLGNAEALAAARMADLRLAPVNKDGGDLKPEEVPQYFQFFRDQRFTSLKFSQSTLDGRACKVPAADEPEDARGPKVVIARTQRGEQSADPPTKPTYSTAFVLRSPEAMLYYLGELARVQLDAEAASDGAGRLRLSYRAERADRRDKPAATFLPFKLERGSAGAAVSVEHQGQVFGIAPSSDGDRSMHVLSLMTQLLGSHNKGSDAPATSNVRVVP